MIVNDDRIDAGEPGRLREVLRVDLIIHRLRQFHARNSGFGQRQSEAGLMHVPLTRRGEVRLLCQRKVVPAPDRGKDSCHRRWNGDHTGVEVGNRRRTAHPGDAGAGRLGQCEVREQAPEHLIADSRCRSDLRLKHVTIQIG